MERIVIDVQGADCPSDIVKGIALTLNEIKDIKIVAVGHKDFIEETLKNETFDEGRLDIVNASEEITNYESPVEAVMKKKDASIVVASKLAKNESDIIGLISAGSTGAVLCSGIFVLGKAQGVERPALTAMLPTIKGRTCLADCGANADCRPNHLLTFATLASEYMKAMFGMTSPRVALLSNGTEDKKGNDLVKSTFQLLKESELDFVGNIEAKTVLNGDVDVIVSDGFNGNVLLKSIEGTAISVLNELMQSLKKYANEESDLDFVKRAYKDFSKKFDLNSGGGAVLLGVNKIVIKAHGSSNAQTVLNTVKQLIALHEGGKKTKEENKNE